MAMVLGGGSWANIFEKFLQNSSFFYNNLFVLVSQFLFFDCIQKRKEIYTNEIGNLWN